MNVIQQIRRAVPEECIMGRSCQVGRLSVRICVSRFSEWILIDVDKLDKKQFGAKKRCDYVFCGYEKKGGELWVVPIEFKKRKRSPTLVLKQLNKGAQWIEQHWTGHERVQFHPLLVAGPGHHPRDYRKLRRGKIKFFGAKVEVIVGDHNRLCLPSDIKRVTAQRFPS